METKIIGYLSRCRQKEMSLAEVKETDEMVAIKVDLSRGRVVSKFQTARSRGKVHV